MAKGTVNKVILVGNLGKDPEVRYTPTGLAAATLTLATTEAWKDKQSGTNQERTEWHRIVLFQRLAEIAGEYLKKGSKIFVEGRLQTRKWQDKTSGQDRYTTEVIADSLQMLDSKGGGRANFEGTQDAPSEKAELSSSGPESSMGNFPTENLDDEIPF